VPSLAFTRISNQTTIKSAHTWSSATKPTRREHHMTYHWV
jgi:hypothetical protein